MERVKLLSDTEIKITRTAPKKPAIPEDMFVKSKELCYNNGLNWIGR